LGRNAPANEPTSLNAAVRRHPSAHRAARIAARLRCRPHEPPQDVHSSRRHGRAPGGGATYLGTAAHCVGSIGQRVRDIEGVEFGSVAFVGDENSTAWDFAFIAVDAEDLGRVSPAVKGHPTFPRGSTTAAETLTGDRIQLSGYGLGYDTTPTTQERRQAFMGFDDAELYTVTGPIHWGDSGGPLVHIGTGKALGIVSRLCAGNCSEEGPTVQGILAKAAASGFPVTLRTV
jgi:hypothetical protein